mmetsp:Transcript_20530/g.60629  ORF Transcript_20530/g.60629 Transcript_20530/m.60629 type:complete len:207 (-) Transcript_20530:1981-2601(-)
MGFAGMPGRTSARSWRFCRAPAAWARRPGSAAGSLAMPMQSASAWVPSSMAALHAGLSAALRARRQRPVCSASTWASISASSLTVACSLPACSRALARVTGRTACVSASMAAISTPSARMAARASARAAQLARAAAAQALARRDSWGCARRSVRTSTPSPVTATVPASGSLGSKGVSSCAVTTASTTSRLTVALRRADTAASCASE